MREEVYDKGKHHRGLEDMAEIPNELSTGIARQAQVVLPVLFLPDFSVQ